VQKRKKGWFCHPFFRFLRKENEVYFLRRLVLVAAGIFLLAFRRRFFLVVFLAAFLFLRRLVVFFFVAFFFAFFLFFLTAIFFLLEKTPNMFRDGNTPVWKKSTKTAIILDIQVVRYMKKMLWAMFRSKFFPNSSSNHP